VCGLDGGIWAQSPGFPAATTAQLLSIVSDFTSEKPTWNESGLWLGTRKFLIVRFDAEDLVLSAKDSTGHGLDGKAQGGVCIKMTAKTLVIGVYDVKDQAGACNVVVEGVGKYLIDAGY